MFSFGKKKEEEAPEWIAEIQETQERFFAFIDKLEAKLIELCDAAIPELEDVFKTDEDPYKRTHGNLLSGIAGQIQNIRQKAHDTYEVKVTDLFRSIKDDVNITDPNHDKLYDFRTACSDKHNNFDDVISFWRERINQTGNVDYEIEYQAIVNDFEKIKNQFNCSQCGANIPITKIYFTISYIKCSSCSTQNTFEPSTKARGLEQVARSLAEQRTYHLLEDYHSENTKEREIYHEAHQLKLGRHDLDKNQKQQIENQLVELENKRQEAIKNAPILYQKYLRAMFDEWNKLIPDLTEQNEKFYLRMLEDANR